MAMPECLTLASKKQGQINDSSEIQGREKNILDYGMTHDITIPAITPDGFGTRKWVHGALTISKEYDPSSPILYQALCNLKEVTIKWYRITKQGTEEHYLTHGSEDAIFDRSLANHFHRGKK